jgi:hypothetical protein
MEQHQLGGYLLPPVLTFQEARIRNDDARGGVSHTAPADASVSSMAEVGPSARTLEEGHYSNAGWLNS